MRRILKMLARLYPAAWRARYGAEYEALLEDAEPRVRDVVDVGWAAVKMWATDWSVAEIVARCALAGGIVAILGSLLIPVRYVSGTAITQVAHYSAPSLVDDGGHRIATADVSHVAQRQRFQEWVSNSFDGQYLASLIQERQLYPRERASIPMSQIVERMLAAIKVKQTSKSHSAEEDRTTFALQFEYEDPHVAQEIDRELVSHLMNSFPTRMPKRPTMRNWEGEGLILGPVASSPQRATSVIQIIYGLSGLLGGSMFGLAMASRRSKPREHC